MLCSLTIRNFILIDSLTLHFTSGFNVLTGETGAGKSILIDAVGLLLGDRADGLQVKKGAKHAEISAEFDMAQRPSIQNWLHKEQFHGAKALHLSRRIDRSGRSRNLINQQAATLAQLKALGEFLIDIHGQHFHQSLIRPQTQRQLLDAYAGATQLAEAVSSTWQAWQQAKLAKQQAENTMYAMQAEREALRFQIEEVASLSLKPNEWSHLNATHQQLANANALLTAAQQALSVLSHNESNCLHYLTQAQQALNKASAIDKNLLALQTMLSSAHVELREVAHQLRHYLDQLKEDPQQLACIESRMDRILTLARKYHVQPDNLLDELEAWQRQFAQLSEEQTLTELAQQEIACQDQFYRLASQLTQQRVVAAQGLAAKIVNKLQQLAMPSARFEIQLTPLSEAHAQGMESVAYVVSTNAGVDLQPLAKVASGGELARLNLAMQVAIGEVSNVPTLIFDEVDNGVGGGVAETIGRLLSHIGASSQVFAITHLPQVAVHGHAHWLVYKVTQAVQIAIRVARLVDKARIEEVARMLGGLTLTDTTRQHAQELLLSAQTPTT